MTDDADKRAQDAIQRAQQQSLATALVMRLVEESPRVEPRIPIGEVATAYLMAAIAIDLGVGVPKIDVARMLRNLADSVDRGDFDAYAGTARFG